MDIFIGQITFFFSITCMYKLRSLKKKFSFRGTVTDRRYTYGFSFRFYINNNYLHVVDYK